MTWDQILERLNVRYADWATPGILVFEISIIVLALLAYRFLHARFLRVGQHFGLIAIGVFALEFFTGPMWKNQNLGFWAYIYSDVSWILTIAWTTMILLTVYLVDTVVGVRGALRRFVLYLVVLTPSTLLFESLTVALGIRAYAPETLAAAGNWRIPLLEVPAAGLYYIPVFMTLVLSFYKHWLPVVERGTAPGERLPLLNRLLLTAAAVFLFEIVVEPMATNQNFPAWSYVFHDITIVMTGLWVAIVTICTVAVDRVLRGVDFRLRFAAYLGLIAAIATPIEGWFIQSGYRVYGPSATADFIGIRTLIGDLPIEVVAAIPLYLALVISFVRYWDGSVDHSLGLRARPAAPRGVPAVELATPTPGRI
jgi:hypothetical protein